MTPELDEQALRVVQVAIAGVVGARYLEHKDEALALEQAPGAVAEAVSLVAQALLEARDHFEAIIGDRGEASDVANKALRKALVASMLEHAEGFDDDTD